VDDSDPRIEQVREEDFPFGTLTLDEEDERKLKECQRRERYRKRDQRRANKLAQCERSWDQSTVEYRQQCLPVRQRKQAAALAEQRRLETEDQGWQEQHRSRVHLPEPATRSLLSSKSPYDTNEGGSYSFEYTVTTNPSSPVDIPSPSSPKSSELRREPLFLSASQSVPFRQVSVRMNGALFPNDDVQTDLHSRKRQPHTLLEVLLQPVTWEQGERSEARVRRRSSLPSFSTWSSNVSLCSACSSTTGSPSTIGSSESGRQIIGVRRLTISTSTPTTCASSARSLCGAHLLTPIDPQECPLFIIEKRSSLQPNAPPAIHRPKSRSYLAKRLVRKIGISVSTFMDVAAQFQASYLRTAGFIVQLETIPPGDETSAATWDAGRPTASKKAKPRSNTKIPLPFDPTNPRAKISDTAEFIRGTAWSESKEELDPEEEHYTLIQLLSPSERMNPSPSSTSPLSVFITPSPLRPRDSPTTLRYRIRPIANPVLLRLKALQNVCAGEGVEWEGRAREGALGFGRDRLQGVAFDGIGRSRLSWEVSF